MSVAHTVGYFRSISAFILYAFNVPHLVCPSLPPSLAVCSLERTTDCNLCSTHTSIWFVCVFVCFAFLKNKFLIASRPTEADYSPNNLALEAAAAKPIAKEFAA